LEIYFADDKPPVHCESLVDLDTTLDRLHRNCDPRYPILVCIDLPTHRLDMGLGSNPTFVIVNTQPCDGEYWISVGDERARGVTAFHGCGAHQEYDNRHLVPLELARAAIREFVRSGRRTPEILWEDWAGRRAEPGDA
jgi:immunity protein Imm1 of predicted polymorphic toxin system